LGECFGILPGILVPFGPAQGVEVLMVERLLLVAADGIEEFDERTGEDVGRQP